MKISNKEDYDKLGNSWCDKLEKRNERISFGQALRMIWWQITGQKYRNVFFIEHYLGTKNIDEAWSNAKELDKSFMITYLFQKGWEK